MKKMLKKNQIVLTVLAVMIAVAGYLTYTGANKDLLNAGTDNVIDENTGLMDISDEDILAENKALQDVRPRMKQTGSLEKPYSPAATIPL